MSTYLLDTLIENRKVIVESIFDANRNLFISKWKSSTKMHLVTQFRSFYNLTTLAIIKEACVKNVSNALENWIYQSYCLSKPFFANVMVTPTIEFWWTSHNCTGNETMFAVITFWKQDWWVKSHYLCKY